MISVNEHEGAFKGCGYLKVERSLVWALCAMKDLSDGAKRTFLLLLSYSFGKGECWPSEATLARKSGCDEESIRKHLRDLRKQGLIDKCKGRNRWGKTLTKYRITFTQEMALEILAACGWGLLFTGGMAKLLSNLEKTDRHMVHIPKVFLMGYPDLEKSSFITFIMIWSLYNVVNGYIDHKKIAQLRGYSTVKTIRTHLGDAETVGLLGQEERRNAQGKRLPNRIIFHLPSLERCLGSLWRKAQFYKEKKIKTQVTSIGNFFPKLYIGTKEGKYYLKFVFFPTNLSKGAGSMNEEKRGAKARGKEGEVCLAPGDEKQHSHLAKELCEKLGDSGSYGYFLLACKACWQLDGNYEMVYRALGLTKEIKPKLRKPGAYFTRVMNNLLAERGVKLVPHKGGVKTNIPRDDNPTSSTILEVAQEDHEVQEQKGYLLIGDVLKGLVDRELSE